MKRLATAIALLVTLCAGAQTADLMVIGTIGGGYADANIDVSYTAGEAMIETQTTATVIITQGFHQPTATPPTGVEEAPDNEFILYPNPATDVLHLAMGEGNTFGASAVLRIFDTKGQLVHAEELNNLDQKGTLQLQVQALSPGQYHIQLHNRDGHESHLSFVKL